MPIPNVTMEEGPGFQRYSTDNDLTNTAPQPFSMGGKTMVPAQEAGSGVHAGDGRKFIGVFLSADQFGLFVDFTPEGARNFAHSILRGADSVEAYFAAEASAGIEAARKSGGAK